MKPPRFLWKDPELDVTSHEVRSYDGACISCFMITPKRLDKKAPCLIYLHGGGFVLEAAGYHYGNAMRYAKEVGCKVIFPQYRLAPQNPHPVFFEDCYAAFRWAYDNADTLGIDISRIGIGGDSAGSTLAVGVCMMAKERRHPVKFRFQMLPYPYLDARNTSESCRKYTDTPMWNSSLSDRIGPMTKADPANPKPHCVEICNLLCMLIHTDLAPDPAGNNTERNRWCILLQEHYQIHHKWFARFLSLPIHGKP